MAAKVQRRKGSLPKRPKRTYSVKQLAVIEGVRRGLSASEAAKSAGYASPGQVEARPTVGEVLAKLKHAAAEKLIAGRAARLAWFTEVMADERHRIKDRLKAAELLTRMRGEFHDHKTVSGPGGKPIEIYSREIHSLDAESLLKLAMAAKNRLESSNLGTANTAPLQITEQSRVVDASTLGCISRTTHSSTESAAAPILIGSGEAHAERSDGKEVEEKKDVESLEGNESKACKPGKSTPPGGADPLGFP